MYALKFIIVVAAGYLFGSLCWAIIVTKIVTGKDIREMGNRNPGTANVGRSIGKGWAALVLFLDLLKAVVPMLLAKWIFFPQSTSSDYFPVLATGIAAVLGHCKPLYYRFQGGRGAATVMALYYFFVPAEFFIAMMGSFIIVSLFFKGVPYRISRWTSILYIIIAPFLVLALNDVVDIQLFWGISLGGHSWYAVVGVFITSISILLINFSFTRMAFRSLIKKAPSEM